MNRSVFINHEPVQHEVDQSLELMRLFYRLPSDVMREDVLAMVRAYIAALEPSVLREIIES